MGRGKIDLKERKGILGRRERGGRKRRGNREGMNERVWKGGRGKEGKNRSEEEGRRG